MSGAGAARHAVAAALRDALGASARLRADAVVDVEVGGARLSLEVVDAGDAGTVATFGACGVRYRVEQGRVASPDGVRQVLLAALAETERRLRTGADANQGTASTPRDRSQPTVVGLDALGLEGVIRLHAAAVACFPDPAPRTTTSLPTCLTLALRPPEFDRVPAAGVVEPPPGEPCRRCARGFGCPGFGEGTLADEARLRGSPLPNAGDVDATRRFVTEFATVLGVEVPGVVDAFLSFVVGSRVRNRAHTPLEVSLKEVDGVLGRSLRIVDYGPAAGATRLARDEAGARRDAMRAFVAAEVGGHERHALMEFLARAGEFDDAPELSSGVDATEAEVRVQLYAHVGHAEPSRVARAFGITADDLVASGPGALTLVACSPTALESDRLKLYRVCDLDGVPLARLRPFAPRRGLAVWERRAGACVLHKVDFPCTVHFQASQVVEDAFAGGLRADEQRRFRALVDRRFVGAWPTWLSVSRNGSAFYFVPR